MRKLTEALARYTTTSNVTLQEAYKRITENYDGTTDFSKWSELSEAWRWLCIGAALEQGKKDLPESITPEQKQMGIEVEYEHFPLLKGCEDFRSYLAEVIATNHLVESADYYFRDANGKACVRGECK